MIICKNFSTILLYSGEILANETILKMNSTQTTIFCSSADKQGVYYTNNNKRCY